MRNSWCGSKSFNIRALNSTLNRTWPRLCPPFRLFPDCVMTSTRTRGELRGSVQPAWTISAVSDGFLQSSPNRCHVLNPGMRLQALSLHADNTTTWDSVEQRLQPEIINLDLQTPERKSSFGRFACRVPQVFSLWDVASSGDESSEQTTTSWSWNLSRWWPHEPSVFQPLPDFVGVSRRNVLLWSSFEMPLQPHSEGWTPPKRWHSTGASPADLCPSKGPRITNEFLSNGISTLFSILRYSV